jgi:hypothetical protein
MTLETQSNAEKRAKGFFMFGYDRLADDLGVPVVDDHGVPVELKVWNMVKRMHSDRIRPISNQRLPEVSIESVRMSREIVPIKKWAPAKQGANARFSGIMSQDFPELANLGDEQLDRVANSLRRRGTDE